MGTDGAAAAAGAAVAADSLPRKHAEEKLPLRVM